MWLLSVFGSDHESAKRTTIRDIGYILFERQYYEDCDEPHAFALRGMKVLPSLPLPLSSTSLAFFTAAALASSSSPAIIPRSAHNSLQGL